ncbi:DUF19 domain-containing protein [Caenorhabditis elegans]|uniref:DUF19 domain-containing protein n=1 Tax=Caenorhabditis elegans TaxID=6239 RepID=Q5FC37_CAEEL|nr:DUF19 domain-containing protein [Caenorhabditis elegans]CAI46572.1 DUF19 domain-containing protein [Caenorhabditis elegans]|eukprot:NP_001023752.1 Uncharacterized protein CELE_D1086.12 [Caenorhabditis elegans]
MIVLFLTFLTFFTYTIECIPNVTVNEFSADLQKEGRSDPYLMCTMISQTLGNWKLFFEAHHWGSPETLNLTSEEFNQINNICEREAVGLISRSCFLPRLMLKIVCKKVDVLQSEFGKCMKDVQTMKIESEIFESFAKDFSFDGISKKCRLLQDPKMPTDIGETCGEEAQLSFTKKRRLLYYIFDC